MNRARQYFSKDFLSVCSRKALMLIPLTFLITPLFYCFLGYHPEIKLFKLLVYLWYTFFIYLGMTITLTLKKHKNFAYPILAGVAFLCKNILELPVLDIKKHIVYIIDVSIGYELFTDEMGIAEFQYLAIVMFLTSFLAGCFGAIYARKTALEFVSRENTFIFINILAFSTTLFALGFMEHDFDKNAITMFVIYLVCFAVSYFLVRNFAYLNRQLEVYTERGAYNVSGTKRIYAYYFISTTLMSVIPFIVCFFIVPYIVGGIFFIVLSTSNTILLAIGSLFSVKKTKESDSIINDTPLQEITQTIRKQFDEKTVYYMILVTFLTIVCIIFRKQIKKVILAIANYFKIKFKLESEDGLIIIINDETITEIKKEKKAKISYKDYLKKVKGITDIRKRFLSAYNYVFWSIIKNDDDLKGSATPNEIAEKYDETQNPAELYQDMKYGQKFEENSEILSNMTEKVEDLLKDMLR